MFKKVVWLAVLALAMPLAAFANSLDIANAGGVLSGGSSGLSLTGSTLVKVGSVVGSNLGSLTFSTGAFTSGASWIGRHSGAGRHVHHHGERGQWRSQWRDFQRHLQLREMGSDDARGRHPHLHPYGRRGQSERPGCSDYSVDRQCRQVLLQRKRKLVEWRHQPRGS